MLQLRLELELTLRGPFLCKSAALGGYGIDVVALRTPTPDCRPVLPGSQVRGRVRESLREFQQADSTVVTDAEVQRWLGPDVERKAVGFEHGHRPQTVFFSDFIGAPQAAAEDQRTLTRIRIDRRAGAAAEGAMLVIDPAAGPQEELPLLGTVELWAQSPDDLKRMLNAVYRGLCWTPAFGAFRSVGFGRLAAVRVAHAGLTCWQADAGSVGQDFTQLLQKLNGGPVAVDIVTPLPASTTGRPLPTADQTRCELAITLLEPFCTGERRIRRNSVSSTKHLPGAVLKGAVAAVLRRVFGLPDGIDFSQQTLPMPWAALARALSNVRFCAAFPSADTTTERPTWQPESFVKDSTGHVYDAALRPGPFVFSRGTAGFAPAFAIDWKSTDTLGYASGWRQPATEMRLHTAIDSAHRRARFQYLFGQELVRPEGIVWRGVVDLQRVAETDRADVWAALTALLGATPLRIGKTKARAQGALGTGPLPSPDFRPLQDPQQPTAKPDLWVLTLQSPALLFDPDRAAAGGSAEWLRQEYESIFQSPEFGGGSLQLVRHFSRQSLHGGFLGARMARAKQRAYRPLLLTDAGSVFVLQAAGDVLGAQAVVQQWYQEGLPLPSWAEAAYGDHFSTNPFLPQDGFGEIAVNLPCHLQLYPSTVVDL